ncbi:MAG: hypothetical protein L6R39_002483 [Caloplaca ligustica]|nr:MAG: hypothetical protein L6R39_002483 [Caloplaca ligustica]
MGSLTRILSILAVASLCSSLAFNATSVKSLVASTVPDNPVPTSASYVVPNSHVMVVVTKYRILPQPIHLVNIWNLIETGKVALDLLAHQAGGDTAELNVPSIRWAISDLAIQTNDATRHRQTSGGGPFRFDELKATYTGIPVAMAKIGNFECTFLVWRVSSIMRRKVKFLAYGDLRHAALEGLVISNATIELT